MIIANFLNILSVAAAVVAGRMVVHERRPAAPAGFSSQGLAPATEMITLRVGLTSNNVAGLEAKLTSISTPGSSDFRQWLSMDETLGSKPANGPDTPTLSAFNAFATANGLTPSIISPNGDWAAVILPVHQANTLFNTRFEKFTHPALPQAITRTLSVSLPSELVGHIDVLHPTTSFPDPQPRLAAVVPNLEKHSPDASCDTSLATGVITPVCLQELYGIPATPATEKKNALLVTAYVEEFAQTADLAEFLRQFRPDINSSETFTLLTLDNGTNPQGPGEAGFEANLDVQYAAGIATEVPIQFLSIGGDDSVAGFATSLLDTSIFLDGVAQPPSVMTTSYGFSEAGFGSSMATKICNGYMALTSRGVSVIFSSGDGGVRGNHDDFSVCQNNTFDPVFPASCPFVTSVGSTIGFGPETAVNFTGGGFSNVFASPSYQAVAVAGFLETIPSDFAGTFNKTGRGYPDVSLQGWNFDIVWANQTILISGTSASTPTFAAIIALINDRLIAAGKPILGFLNSLIYSKASSAFTDITIGHNSGFLCPASSVAFDAAVGWDPLTGFGTPKFPELLAAAIAY
ncbi:family S53 protease-like protein [Mycena vulgaris]|nr:family S53 protease-like protein [Mycena vulgaris]